MPSSCEKPIEYEAYTSTDHGEEVMLRACWTCCIHALYDHAQCLHAGAQNMAMGDMSGVAAMVNIMALHDAWPQPWQVTTYDVTYGVRRA